MQRHAQRFERCERGSLCHFPHCEQYPTHGVLFDLGSDRKTLIFSEEFALHLLAHTLRPGALSRIDEQRLCEEIERAGLFRDGGITQHDRASFHLVRTGELPEVLDIICGIQPLTEKEQPRLEKYHDSGSDRALYVLYAFKDRRVAIGFTTYHDALLLLRRTWQRGLLNDKDYGRLLGELSELGLPAGSPSLSLYREQSEWLSLPSPPLFKKCGS